MGKISFKDTDTAIRLLLPKIVKIGMNIITLGPGILVRSTVTILRANMATRIVSSLSLLALDIVDLKRARISKPQFIRNIFMSLIMVVGGTLGWYMGASWLVIEFLSAGVAEIVGGILGTVLTIGVTGKAFDVVCDKIHCSDSKAMRIILSKHLTDYDNELKTKILKNVSDSELKKMYASKNREAFANELILKAKKKIKRK